jgi:hypothetical protein
MDPNQNQMPADLGRIIRIGAIGLGVLVLFTVAFIWISSYTNKGSVDITTQDKNNSISISDSTHKVLKTAKSELKLDVAKGTYFVSVTGNYVGATQQISVSAHNTTTLELSPENPSDTEPVYYSPITHVSASPTQLSYLDNASNFAYINTSNAVQTEESISFGDIAWGDPTFGLGVANADGLLYLVENNKTTPFPYPKGVSTPGPVVAVSPTHQMYVGVGKVLYSVTTAGKWTKIYTAPSNITQLSAVKDRVVSLAPTDQAAAEIAVTTSAGQQVAKKTLNAGAVTVSASGKYLALTNGDDTTITDDQLATVQTVPQAGTKNVTWGGDTTLYYSVDDKIWSYDVGAQKSQIIGIAPLGNPITELAVNTDASYLYIGATTNDTFQIQQLFRIGLRHQAVSKTVTNLQLILPLKEDLYSMLLVNFSGLPTVLVQPVLGATPDMVEPQVRSELQGRGFDLSQLRIVVGPPVS